MLKIPQSPFQSTKLISLDQYFDELVKLFESDSLPKVLLLTGKKGLGKFTLIFHFLNYVYSKNEKTPYNVEDKLINTNSKFYNSILDKTCPDVIFLQALEGKNIKIDDIRNLKSVLSRSSLSKNPRFVIIDEVEFLNINSINALLKTLEEPRDNNYFILINNQQADLIETVSSRCLKNNIYLSSKKQKKIIDYFIKDNKIDIQIDSQVNLTPGVLLKYNELHNRYKLNNEENILAKINKLLHAYKKDKDKTTINMSVFLIDHFFYLLVQKNINKIDILINLKSSIINKINDFLIYNLNISSVLKSIELELKNVR
jgi:DNA polymerase-3 subunit delta'|tara:strand:+ start:1012 stop:1953 length:942 start_codon:yes stop_codon:yes gene_type:complete